MKSIILLIGVLSLSANTVMAAKETPCHTDGCVDRKNRQMNAVYNYINEVDDCTNAVSWMHSLTRVNDDIFVAVCGDTHDKTKIYFKATQNMEGDTFEVKVIE